MVGGEKGKSMQFKFNEKRSTQAAAFLIKRNDNVLNYMKLIKLLYLVDRAALLKWQQPITGDKYYSLPKGPIVSNILDKICNRPNPEAPDFWSSIIRKSDTDCYAVTTISDVEYDELSKRELKLLEHMDERFKKLSQWDMVDYCHKNLPEWKDPNGSSDQITIADIFNAKFPDGPDMVQHLINTVEFKVDIDQMNHEMLDATR